MYVKCKEVNSETSAFVQYEFDIELMSYYVLVLLLFCTFLFVWICVCWECFLFLEKKKTLLIICSALLIAGYYGRALSCSVLGMLMRRCPGSPSGNKAVRGAMEPATRVKNFDKRMTGASVIDDALKEVFLKAYFTAAHFFPYPLSQCGEALSKEN